MASRNPPASADAVEAPAARLLRNAERCRARELRQLFVLCELVRAVSSLVHALQKERGVSSIFLGSRGAQFGEQLQACVSDSASLELAVRNRIDHTDEQIEQLRAGARFYTRVALALTALDMLPEVRAQTTALTLAPQQAVRLFSDIVAQLLAVGFEAADNAADPETSSALVALVSFAQGKEYAGQERATAGAGFSRGLFEPSEQERLRHLQAGQERAFQMFARFAREPQVALAAQARRATEVAPLECMRAAAIGHAPLDRPSGELAAAWYELTTRRIDAMKGVEDQLAADLGELCTHRLAQAQNVADTVRPSLRSGARMAMLVTELDQGAHEVGLAGGIGLYALEEGLPKPLHSILSVVEAQARLLDDVSSQLQTANTALSERKTIERAKGLLMRSRRLSEQSAYELMRRTAMSQNQRLADVAETILSMADLFKT